jgi:hypothetical protein
MRTTLSAILFAVAAAAASAQPVSVPQPPPGFTVTIPAGWQHQIFGAAPVYLAATPPGGGARCVVSAAANALQGTQATLNQRPMTPLDKADWLSIFPFYVNYKPNFSDVGLHQSGIMAYRGNMRVIEAATNRRLQVLAYILATAGQTWGVACASLESNWSQNEADMTAFAGSFSVNGITLAKPYPAAKPLGDANKQELEALAKGAGPYLEEYLTFPDTQKD